MLIDVKRLGGFRSPPPLATHSLECHATHPDVEGRRLSVSAKQTTKKRFPSMGGGAGLLGVAGGAGVEGGVDEGRRQAGAGRVELLGVPRKKNEARCVPFQVLTDLRGHFVAWVLWPWG